ncbi:ABC transporter ATP-binding protein [Amycolatopsis sp. NPDC059027]|uniref:ABC transporter ATP-binding protein n=1 Tax=Amycolatopsis sp. NPDC059027 TaxID=3346709 RepID=UPI00366AE672
MTMVATDTEPTDTSPAAPGGGTERSALRALVRPVRGRLAFAVGLQILSATAGVVPFIAVAELGRVLLADGPADAGRAWTITLVGATALLLRLILLALAGLVTHLADNDLQLRIRRRLADRLARVPLGWFGRHSSGSVNQALQSDVTALHHLVAHSPAELASAIVVPLVSLGYLVTVDWRMTLVALVPPSLGLLVHFRLGAGDRKREQDTVDRAMARIAGSAVEYVQGIAVVKTFGQSGRAHERFRAAAHDFSDFFLGWVRTVVHLAASRNFLLSPVFSLLVLLAGGIGLAAGGALAPVDVLPFALLGLALTAPVAALGHGGDSLRAGRLAAARITTLLATPELATPAGGTAPKERTVEFRDVRFSYDDQVDVLRGVDLTLSPGTVTALVGPSGSGKSTVAALLPRFFDTTAGSISIGGVDIRRIPPAELYRLVAFVFQDVQLLRAPAIDNLRLARPDATVDEVRSAARAVRLHERLLAAPHGYDSVIGEDIELSRGEAQRMSIARALLADAPILVLDEATASADSESESAIQDAVSTLVAGRTLLVIAHRLSTIVRADQIVVLGNGRVVERGTHEELLGLHGTYARMWHSHDRSDQSTVDVKEERP